MPIQRNDGLSDLLRATEASRICTGFAFTEGPVWVAGDECLLFSDIPNNRIHRWRPGMDVAEIYREPSRNSNGLTLDRGGNLLACEHSGRQISHGAYGGAETTLVDRFEEQRLNSPNDVVVHSSGAIYFTDPTYGIRDSRAAGLEVEQELPHQGVYRLDADGTLILLDASFSQPNGIAFSPDESLLYVGDSQELIVRRFRVLPDGRLADGTMFVNMRGHERAGPPDGMKVDEEGRLWSTGSGGVWVVEPDGHLLGVLAIPAEYPANLTFGGPEFSTLYFTAHTSVYQIETTVRGIAPGSRG